jgi:hypothetical protein
MYQILLGILLLGIAIGFAYFVTVQAERRQ